MVGSYREILCSNLFFSKNVSYAVWCPQTSRARILLAHGNFLATMGHNVPRNYDTPAVGPEARKKIEKVVELLPEEALYLIERGSMLCWSRHDRDTPEEGAPMSLQQAYAEMIGKQELTLERYQVPAGVICASISCSPSFRLTRI